MAGAISPEEIERRRQESGTIEFARMYLLDLAAASGAHLRREWLNRYPHPASIPAGR